jgi:hypothetical protein
MGFSPREVDQMTLWEMNACIDFHRRANGAEDEVAPPSFEEHQDMVRRLG